MEGKDEAIPTRHPGLDPGSTFFPNRREGRWIPDQVRDDQGVKEEAVTK
jgi:hypothetical protein